MYNRVIQLYIYCCSVAKSCPTLCDPMECSAPGFPVLHYLPEFAQTYVHIYVCVCIYIYAAAKLLQSCPTLCDPIDGIPPGSPVPGILQTRTLEWVAISFSNAWKWKVKVRSLSRVWLLATPWTAAHQVPPSMGFSRQEHWSGLPFPSPMHESEKWKWSHSVMSDSLCPHGLQPTRLLCPWDFPGKSTGVGCHCLLHLKQYTFY